MDAKEAISSMIDSIVNGDNNKAKEDFGSIVGVKVADALDTRKVELAQSLYTQDTVQDNEQETAEEDETQSETN